MAYDILKITLTVAYHNHEGTLNIPMQTALQQVSQHLLLTLRPLCDLELAAGKVGDWRLLPGEREPEEEGGTREGGWISKETGDKDGPVGFNWTLMQDRRGDEFH